MDTLITAGFPSLLILIIGFFLNKYFQDNKDFQNETKINRETTILKLDSIIKSVSKIDKENALIDQKLDGHIEKDDSVQETINYNIAMISKHLNIN